MLKKLGTILTIFFLCIFSQKNYANIEVKILASVDEKIITNIDLNNEIMFLKITQSSYPNNKKIKLDNIAINNLIEQHLKEIETKKYNIEISKELIEEHYLQTIKGLENIENKEILSKSLKNLLYNKIKISLEWNQLINRLYAWKLSINMEEIEYKVAKLKNKDNDIKKIKQKLIDQEKLKKITIFSNYHLKKIRKNSHIKFY